MADEPERTPLPPIAITVAMAAGAMREIRPAAQGRLVWALKLAGLPVPAICKGRRACGTCRVQVDPGWFDRLPPPDRGELNLLACLQNRSALDRLACQIALTPGLDGLVIRLAC